MSSDGITELQDAATRRLWFLQILMGQMEPEKALALAASMEAFVAGGGTLPARGDGEQQQIAQDFPAKLAVPRATAAGEAWKVSPPPAERPRPDTAPRTPSVDSPGRLLTSGELQEFQDQALKGATNTDLAQRFGLTPRQANGIRMGLAKRVPQVALKRGVAKAPKIGLDRATELQMQSAFLQQKAKTPATVEDVVRYLRQRGDVVTRSGQAFSVNYRDILTEEELFRRANEKRAQLGLPAFSGSIESSQPTVLHRCPLPLL